MKPSLLLLLLTLSVNISALPLLQYEEWKTRLPSDYDQSIVQRIVVTLREQLDNGKNVVLSEFNVNDISVNGISTIKGFIRYPISENCYVKDKSTIHCDKITRWEIGYKPIELSQLLNGQTIFLLDFLRILQEQGVSSNDFQIFIDLFAQILAEGNLAELPNLGYFSLAPARGRKSPSWLHFSENVIPSESSMKQRQAIADLDYIHPLVDYNNKPIQIPNSYSSIYGECHYYSETQSIECSKDEIPGITFIDTRWIHNENEDATHDVKGIVNGCGNIAITIRKNEPGIIQIKDWARIPDNWKTETGEWSEWVYWVQVGTHPFAYDYSISFQQPPQTLPCLSAHDEAYCEEEQYPEEIIFTYGDNVYMNSGHGPGEVFLPGGGRGNNEEMYGGVEVMVDAQKFDPTFYTMLPGESLFYTLDTCKEFAEYNMQEPMDKLQENSRIVSESVGFTNPNDRDFFGNPIDGTYGLFDFPLNFGNPIDVTYPSVETAMGPFSSTPYLSYPAFWYVEASSSEKETYSNYFVSLLERDMEESMYEGIRRGTRDSASLLFMKPDDINERLLQFGEQNNGMVDWLRNEVQSVADLGRYLLALDYYHTKYGQPVTSLDAYSEIFVRWNDATTNKLLDIAMFPFVGTEQTIRYSMELSGISTDEKDIANSLKANKGLTDLETAIQAFNIASRNQMMLTVIPVSMVMLAPQGEIKLFQRGSGSFAALEQAVTSAKAQDAVAKVAAEEAVSRLSQLDPVDDMLAIMQATEARKVLVDASFRETFFKFITGAEHAGKIGARALAKYESFKRFFGTSHNNLDLQNMLQKTDEIGVIVEDHNVLINQLAENLIDYGNRNGLLRQITSKLSKEKQIATLPIRTYDQLMGHIATDKILSENIVSILDKIIQKRAYALEVYADIDYYAAQLGLTSPLIDAKNYANVLQWASFYMIRQGFNGEMPNLYAHVTRLGFGIPPSIAKIEDVGLRTEKYREWIYNQYDYFVKTEGKADISIENAYIASMMTPEQMQKLADYYQKIQSMPILTDSKMVIKLFGTLGPDLVGTQSNLRKKIADMAVQRGKCLAELETMVDSEANTLVAMWDKAESLKTEYETLYRMPHGAGQMRSELTLLRARHKMAIEEYKHFDKIKKTRQQLVLEGKATWLGGQIIGANEALKSVNDMIRLRAGITMEGGNIGGLNPYQLALYNKGLTQFDITSNLTLPVLKEPNRAIAIIGSRTIDPLAARETMEMYINPNFFEGSNLVISGGAKGGDELAKVISDTYGLPPWTFPARWTEFGNSAGPMRNTTIVENADLILALGWRANPSPGTSDSIAKALALGKPVYFFDIGTGKGEYLTDPLRHGTRGLKRGVRAVNYNDYFAGTGAEDVPRDPETILFDSVNNDKKQQSIYFNLPETVYVRDNLALFATATSGLPVSFDYDLFMSPCSTNVFDDELFFVRDGTCTITASQPGNDEYEEAESVTVSTEIIKKTPEFTSIELIHIISSPPGDTHQLSEEDENPCYKTLLPSLNHRATIDDEAAINIISTNRTSWITEESKSPKVCEKLGGNVYLFKKLGICNIHIEQYGNEEYEPGKTSFSISVFKKLQRITYTYEPIVGEKPEYILGQNPIFYVGDKATFFGKSNSLMISLFKPITFTAEGACEYSSRKKIISYLTPGECRIKVFQRGDKEYSCYYMEAVFTVQ